MNVTRPTAHRLAAILGLAASLAVMLLLHGCQKAQPTEEKASPHGSEAPAKSAASEADGKVAADAGNADDAGDKAEGHEEGVSLKPEEVQAMGIETTEARAIDSTPEVPGFAVVLPHETVASAVAEIRTAAAAARQSRSALERSKRLAGTPGAMPAEVQETAERQAIADQAALELARQKLSAAFGQNPPWKSADTSPELIALASGQSKLVHVTFPLGSLRASNLSAVRLARIDEAQGGHSWRSAVVWHAPADATIPGRSYFTILKNTEAGEGDHLLAWAPVGEPEHGVLVPSSAAVISGGQFWCYIEEHSNTFVKTQFDPGRPTEEGYFVKEGISVGDKIVTAAAGQLLARESNPSKEPE